MIERELCGSDEMANNTMREFAIKLDDATSVTVLLIKYENAFSCLASRCTHYSVPLSMGVLHNGRLRCMAHGASFDVKTGDIEDYPGPDCLPSYPVYVNHSTGMVHLKALRLVFFFKF